MSEVEHMHDAAADCRLCSELWDWSVTGCVNKNCQKVFYSQRRRYDMATYINPEPIHIIFLH